MNGASVAEGAGGAPAACPQALSIQAQRADTATALVDIDPSAYAGQLETSPGETRESARTLGVS